MLIDQEGITIPVHLRRRRINWEEMEKVETYTFYGTSCIGFLSKAKARKLEQTRMNSPATGLFDAAIPLKRIRKKDVHRVVATILKAYRG